MIIVTGGAGFIGSNLVKRLNALGHEDILVVDNLSNGVKFRNIADCLVYDYLDKQEFIKLIRNNEFKDDAFEMIFHQGACSVTTEWDGRYMMENNYRYSKDLLNYCERVGIPFIYASSAAVYGTGTRFAEQINNERPINVYGYSKSLFDQYVRKRLPESNIKIIGLRYFNVYGPRETHKESMASVAFHLNRQLQDSDTIKLFKGCHGFADGEQRRDFISVDDVVSVNLWGMQEDAPSGIYNVGTGMSRSFNDVAKAIIDWHGRGQVSYIEFPEKLKNSYQSFTEADLTALRQAGYQGSFMTLEEGIGAYMDWLKGE